MAGQQQIGVELVVVGLAGLSRAMRTAQDDLDRTATSIQRVSGVSAGMGSALTTLGSNMQRIGRAMLIDISAPLGILTGVMINAGIQFEDAFAGIGKTVGGISVGFDEIKAAAQSQLGITITTMDEARDAANQLGMAFGDLLPVGQEVRAEFRQMALDIPMSASDLANLGEIVGQLGIEAPEVGKVTKMVAELGLTTNMSSEDAAMGLIRMANIMRSTVGPNAISMAEFIQRAGSAVVDLGNKSVATESEIMNFALRLSAAGDMANMSEQDVLAWSTTLADLGARSESGGTAVSRALENMIIAVQSGSKELGLFAQVAGMSATEFQKAFQEDASSALGMFTQKLKESFEAGNINKDMLTQMGLGGIRAFDILGRLGNAQELLAKNTNNANTAWEQAIALENEAEKRFNTFKSQLQILKNTFTDLGISIFDLVEGDLKALLGYVKDAINWFKGLDSGLQRNIVIFAALAAIIGPLLIILGGLVSALGVIATGITAIGTAALPVIGIIAALGVALGALAPGFKFPSLGKTPTATGTEGAGATEDTTGALEDQTKEAGQAAEATQRYEFMWVRVKEKVDDVGDAINGVVEDTKNIPPLQFKWVQVKVPSTKMPMTEMAKERIKDVEVAPTKYESGTSSVAPTPELSPWETFLKFIQVDIPNAFSNLMVTLKPFTDLLAGIVSEDMKASWDDLKKAWDNLVVSSGPLIEALKTILPIIGVALIAVITLVILTISNLIQAFAKVATNLGTFIQGVGNLLSGVIAMLKGAWTAVSGLINFIIGIFKAAYQMLTGDTQGAVDTINTMILGGLNNIMTGAKEFADGLVQALTGAWDMIYASVKSVFDLIVTYFTGWWSDITDIFQGLSDDLVGHSIVTDMADQILGVFTNIKDTALQIITDLVGGITNAFTNIGSTISGGLGGALGGAGQAQTGGAGAEQQGGPQDAGALFNLAQIQALQEAAIGLQETWSVVGTTMSTVFNSIGASLLGIITNVKTLATTIALSFTVPMQVEMAGFSAIFTAQITMLTTLWRTMCLNMFKSWLDFTTNAGIQTVQFVVASIGAFGLLKSGAMGIFNEVANAFTQGFGSGGTADVALANFTGRIGGIAPAFGRLKSAVAGFVSSMIALLKTICDAANSVMGCVTGSPELKLQHPFELFEKYIKGTDYGSLISKSMSMPALENVMTVIPNQQGNTTNIDRSITSTITGLPITTAEGVADTMLRQVRMGESLQGA